MTSHGRDVHLSELSPPTLPSFVLSLASHLPALLLSTWPLLAPVLAFSLFVLLLNEGGIVVGDKDHHRLVLHAAMPLHLFMGAALLLGPREMALGALELATHATSALQSKSTSALQKGKSALLVCLFFCGVSLVLYQGCLSHPFLEADNRWVGEARLACLLVTSA
jgi:hypothetical protein